MFLSGIQAFELSNDFDGVTLLGKSDYAVAMLAGRGGQDGDSLLCGLGISAARVKGGNYCYEHHRDKDELSFHDL